MNEQEDSRDAKTRERKIKGPSVQIVNHKERTSLWTLTTPYVKEVEKLCSTMQTYPSVYSSDELGFIVSSIRVKG